MASLRVSKLRRRKEAVLKINNKILLCNREIQLRVSSMSTTLIAAMTQRRRIARVEVVLAIIHPIILSKRTLKFICHCA